MLCLPVLCLPLPASAALPRCRLPALRCAAAVALQAAATAAARPTEAPLAMATHLPQRTAATPRPPARARTTADVAATARTLVSNATTLRFRGCAAARPRWRWEKASSRRARPRAERAKRRDRHRAVLEHASSVSHGGRTAWCRPRFLMQKVAAAASLLRLAPAASHPRATRSPRCRLVAVPASLPRPALCRPLRRCRVRLPR
jgi:hypothetical protein